MRWRRSWGTQFGEREGGMATPRAAGERWRKWWPAALLGVARAGRARPGLFIAQRRGRISKRGRG